MKQLLSYILLLSGLLTTSPAPAWMYWYHTPLQHAPVQSWYMHLPGLFSYSHIPYGAIQSWQFNSMQQPGGVYVEQVRRRDGYSYRIHLAGHRREDIRVTIEGSALLVRSIAGQDAFTPYGTQRIGSFTQWLLLPADANPSAMRWSAHDGVLEVFIPRMH